jgi:hypothetical protein
LLALLSFGAARLAAARVWTDSTGKHTIEAELLKVADGQVHLKKADGMVVVVPLERLSDADQRYLKTARPPAAGADPVESKKPASAAKRRPPKGAALRVGRAAIEQELAKRTRYDFQNQPLHEVLAQLAEAQQIPLFLDRRTLDAEGVKWDTPVTAQGAGEPLEQALNAILHPLRLTWLVREEVLFVTSQKSADTRLETRLYRVTRPVAKPKEFMDQIVAQIAPKTWEQVGGPGALRPWPLGALVVSQTYAVHRQLEQQHAKTLQALAEDARLVRRPVTARPTLKDILGQPCLLEFMETPLANVARTLAERYRMELTLDEKSLQAAGVNSDVPITCRLHDVKLESALTLVLEQLGLLWTVRGDQLVITTPEGEAGRLLTIEYNVRDLVYAVPGESDVVANLVLAMVTPQAWSQVGGPATLKPAEDGGVLEIKHSFRAHLEVDRLLAGLRRFGKS